MTLLVPLIMPNVKTIQYSVSCQKLAFITKVNLGWQRERREALLVILKIDHMMAFINSGQFHSYS